MCKLPNEFFPITLSDKEILLPWIGSERDELYKKHGFHTGIDLYAENVYSLCSGVVTHIGTDGKYTAVTIQYDREISLRYLHLQSVFVAAGQIVQQGFCIGAADQYVHFEYITRTKGDSIWPVRIGSQTYYKQNPLEIHFVSVETKAELYDGEGSSD